MFDLIFVTSGLTRQPSAFCWALFYQLASVVECLGEVKFSLCADGSFARCLFCEQMRKSALFVQIDSLSMSLDYVVSAGIASTLQRKNIN